MSSSFANKVVVVAGGFSGIGLAVVVRLLEQSAIVHAVDIAASQPSSIPEGAAFFHPSVDVSSRKAVSQLFESILKQSPTIHCLVNCAGIAPSMSTKIESDETYQRIMDVNCGGMWMLGTEFLRYVQSIHDEGRQPHATSIVGIGSCASLRGYPSLAVYSCSKHAMLGLIRAWAQEYVKLGVRVNLVAPGATFTPMFQAQMASAGLRAESTKQAVASIPMARWAEPSEIADSVLFLLSDSATYITGQALAVNGGEF
jgi:NAD(P)-dependent dehydrogenase (short-subunit alcohol dehydrogenase family)